MKVYKAGYIASFLPDGLPLPGVLVKRFLRRPVFYAADTNCSLAPIVIDKLSEPNVIVYYDGITTDKIKEIMNQRIAKQKASLLRQSKEILKVTPRTTTELLRYEAAKLAVEQLDSNKE